jgi:glycosyltransferase A (GT-A) superfamily protein (DUF2064 family)
MSSLSSHPLPVELLLLVTITIVLGPNKHGSRYAGGIKAATNCLADLPWPTSTLAKTKVTIK